MGQEPYVGGGGGGQGAMARHGAVRPTHPAGAVPGPVIWSKAEDDLLLAITHEFGVNWTMVGAGLGRVLCCAVLRCAVLPPRTNRCLLQRGSAVLRCASSSHEPEVPAAALQQPRCRHAVLSQGGDP